jgi:hypothetical protein
VLTENQSDDSAKDPSEEEYDEFIEISGQILEKFN